MTKLPKYSPQITSNVLFKPKVIRKNDIQSSKKNVNSKSSEFYRTMMPKDSDIFNDVNDIEIDEARSTAEVIDDSEPHRMQRTKKTVGKKSLQRSFMTPQTVSASGPSSRKTIIRRPLASLNNNLRMLKKKMNNFSQLLQNKNSKDVQPKRPLEHREHERKTTYMMPNLSESIVVEDGEEFVVIGDTAIRAENLAEILRKSTMRQQVNLIIKELWPSEILENMFINDRHKNENHFKVTNQECKKIKDLCLYLQQKRELSWIPGSRDDITIYLKTWIGAYLNEHRRQLKIKEGNQT
ncbi:uncharacterized protein LOC123267067 [Cotesia glomerata]|nr:uncharacterized protein LOC123267067 [Cotesia glomerata]